MGDIGSVHIATNGGLTPKSTHPGRDVSVSETCSHTHTPNNGHTHSQQHIDKTWATPRSISQPQ